MTQETQKPQSNIPVVTNRTFPVNEVKILLEKQACANEFIHAEMTMEQAKRRVLNAPTVSFQYGWQRLVYDQLGIKYADLSTCDKVNQNYKPTDCDKPTILYHVLATVNFKNDGKTLF